MAVVSTNRIAGPFIGSVGTTVFPFNFKVFTAADLYVLRDNGYAMTVLTLGVDYTATLNANQDVSPGGAVTLTTGLISGSRLTITSDIPELQQVILTNLGGFFPSVLNNEFDLLTILIQQLQLGVNQSIKFGLTDDLSTVNLPPAAQRAGKFFYFGADGSVSLLSQAPSSGTQFNFSGVLTGTRDGVNTIFTITNAGSSIGSTPVQEFITVNGYLMSPVIGYSLGPAPGQVNFVVAPSPVDDLYGKGVFVP